MNIKHYELINIANKFLEENYDISLDIPIEFNTRLKRVFGRFVSSKSKGSVKIEMSVDFIINHPKNHIIDVFKHELVHYALFEKGLPFHDGDPIFESELKKHGVSSTHTYEYLGEVHRYICENCNKIFEKKRRLVKTAYCGCSNGPNLTYEGVFKKEYKTDQDNKIISLSS